MTVIPALGKMRQEGHEFEASDKFEALNIVRLCLKKNK
jgi:hypothetical protein